MKALILLAEGFEEIEAIVTIDVLRRGNFDVTVAGLNSEVVTASRKTKHIADTLFAEVSNLEYDIIILPGGRPGADHLRDDLELTNFLIKHAKRDKWLAAICAAPIALNHAGLLDNKNFTCHPSAKDEINNGSHQEKAVCVDNKIITAKSAGVTFEFAFEIIKQLSGRRAVAELNLGLFYAGLSQK